MTEALDHHPHDGNRVVWPPMPYSRSIFARAPRPRIGAQGHRRVGVFDPRQADGTLQTLQ